MSRSVFLSSCGDPFLTLFVHKLYRERWSDFISNFYINYNNHCGVSQPVVAEVFKRLSEDPKTHIIYHPKGIGNGTPITEMTRISQDDVVMLIEDDGFIFNPETMDASFKKIESGETDIVGSPRFSCGTEVGESLKKLYNLDYSGYGDVGPNWWPNFFFCKREHLLKTDLNFGSKEFKKNVYYRELDNIMSQKEYGDTFVWACIQLRFQGLRYQSVPQHKADPYEIESKQKGEMNWHPSQQPFHWIHGGSLSSGWGGYLSGRIPEATDDNSKREIESRCAFWTIVSDTVVGLDDFKQHYKQGIRYLVENYGLDQENINKKIIIYKQLMNV